jgi:drug/metabolite transporter (DMT)-like permease
MNNSPARNRLLLVAAAVLFSTGGAVIKAATLTAFQVACFRSGVAAVAVLLALPESRRWSAKLILPAVAYAATLVLFTLSTRLTTAANAIFLQSTAPLYLLIIGPVFLRERIRRSDLLVALAVTIGMILLFVGSEPAVATAPNPRLGNTLAALSGLTWAFTVTGLRLTARSANGNAAVATVALGNIIACLATLPLALPLNSVSAADAVVILYLGIFQIGLAYVCVTSAIRHVPAFEASIVLMLEPVLNPIWTWLVHGERAGTWSLAGGVLILLATVIETRRARLPESSMS